MTADFPKDRELVLTRLIDAPREAVYRVFDPRGNAEAVLRHLAESEMEDAVRPDEFRQVLVAQADVDRVPMPAAVPLVADQVPERGRHARPDRRRALPEQTTLDELRSHGRRFDQERGQD